MPCFGGTFEVNFRPLIQLNSRGLLNSFDGGQPGLSGCIGIIVCLDAEAFKQGRSRFLFTCATLGAVRVATSVLYFVHSMHNTLHTDTFKISIQICAVDN